AVRERVVNREGGFCFEQPQAIAQEYSGGEVFAEGQSAVGDVATTGDGKRVQAELVADLVGERLALVDAEIGDGADQRIAVLIIANFGKRASGNQHRDDVPIGQGGR